MFTDEEKGESLDGCGSEQKINKRENNQAEEYGYWPVSFSASPSSLFCNF